MSDRRWIYVLGERSGKDIKIGESRGGTMRDRVATVNGDQTTTDKYVLLCAVRGSHKDEVALLRHFEYARRDDKGTRREYFQPVAALLEYVHWLRAQWWSVVDENVPARDAAVVEADRWLPGEAGRGLTVPEADPEVLIQAWQILDGPLAGTWWDWLPDPRPSIQDYYTPPELIAAARDAMGGLDLDAASHWLANRTFHIPDYFTIGRSAFEHDWHGRVWLNPPYGENAAWFDRIIAEHDAGHIDQLCMLSPVWAFNTRIAAEFMRRVSAMLLFSPTPKFWGHVDGRTGTNNPHAVVYVGDRVDEFFRAFQPYGIPFSIPTLAAS